MKEQVPFPGALQGRPHFYWLLSTLCPIGASSSQLWTRQRLQFWPSPCLVLWGPIEQHLSSSRGHSLIPLILEKAPHPLPQANWI